MFFLLVCRYRKSGVTFSAVSLSHCMQMTSGCHKQYTTYSVFKSRKIKMADKGLQWRNWIQCVCEVIKEFNGCLFHDDRVGIKCVAEMSGCILENIFLFKGRIVIFTVRECAKWSLYCNWYVRRTLIISKNYWSSREFYKKNYIIIKIIVMKKIYFTKMII